MKENSKTIVFAVAITLVVAFAWGDAYRARKRLDVGDTADAHGQLLYKDFKDPLAVHALDITTYDEAAGMPRAFQVAVAAKSNLWSIPSHFNYPADAKDQVAEAASGLMDLKVLEVAGDSVQDHETYGVVDPQAKDLKPGAAGVGMHVTMKDANGKALLDLIIGKPVPGKTELRYVRKAGESQVYTVAAKVDKLSTKFEDWIEKNLLKFNSFDLKQIEIHDHAIDPLRGVLLLKGEITAVNNEPNEPKWLISENKVFDPRTKQWVDHKLTPDQEAKASKLDEIKTAFDDLKIVDVEPKPAGLSADLKASEDFKKNDQAVESLQNCGFYLAKMGDKYELFSNQGEIRCVMKTGVQYVLRFGDTAQGTGGGTSAKKEEKKASNGPNRYIFVTAEFRPDMLAKPQLDPLPELAKEEPKKDEAKKDGVKKDDAKKADGKKADADKAVAAKKDDKKDEKKEEKPAKKPEEIKAERTRIEKENKRKQDEYDEKVKSGQKEVKELNARFANWYYVISDDVFRKIHVNREDLIQKKEKKDEKKDDKKADEHAGHDHGAGFDPADFDKLKESLPGKK